MTVSSLAISVLAAGMLLVVLVCYARAAFNQPVSRSLMLTLSLALACAALAVAGWSDLADRNFDQGLALVGAALLVAVIGMYSQRRSIPRAALTRAIVLRLAPNDSRRFLFFSIIFLGSLIIAPWLVDMGTIDQFLISLGFGSLFALIACIIEFEVMHRGKQHGS